MFVPYPLFPSAEAVGFFFHNVYFDILPTGEVLGTVKLSKSHSVQYMYKLYLVIIHFPFIMHNAIPWVTAVNPSSTSTIDAPLECVQNIFLRE